MTEQQKKPEYDPGLSCVMMLYGGAAFIIGTGTVCEGLSVHLSRDAEGGLGVVTAGLMILGLGGYGFIKSLKNGENE